MSRIQNILEKAEREGGVRRMRTLVETTPVPPRALDIATAEAPAPIAPPVGAAPIAAPISAAVAAPSAERIATSTTSTTVPAAAATRVLTSKGLDPA